MKVLNLYCGIGGNRKLWNSPGLEVTAIEYDETIAQIYQDYNPKDKVIVTDAHQYLLDHYEEFDFIWSSPPCPTHSITNHFLNAQGIKRYPDMALYQEIILLQTFFKGKYIVENVKSYYDPLIEPQISGRHYFWANFKIPHLEYKKQIGRMNGKKKTIGETQYNVRSNNHKKLGFDLSKYKHKNKDKLLNNCVAPEIGDAIFKSALGIYKANNVKQVNLLDAIEREEQQNNQS